VIELGHNPAGDIAIGGALTRIRDRAKEQTPGFGTHAGGALPLRASELIRVLDDGIAERIP